MKISIDVFTNKLPNSLLHHQPLGPEKRSTSVSALKMAHTQRNSIE